MKRVLCLLIGCLIVFSVVSVPIPAAEADASFTFSDEPAVCDANDGIDADVLERYGSAGIAPTGDDADTETKVPQIRVNTESGNGASLQKEDGYVNATISITDNDGSVLSDSCSFKVRGNTTAMTHVKKKAFAVKFSKKKEVLGMGVGKKWVLLANTFDPSLLRNYLATDFARELGLAYTSEQRYAELWLDGEYRGCYTVYEQIQEGKDRVDIDIESNDGKKDFLIEYEKINEEDDKKYFTVDNWRFCVKEPDDTTDDQLQYISDVMTGIVEKLKSGKREDAESVIDIPSFVKFYLVNEFMKNMDFDMSSVYFYYKDGKLYAGPVWDFDQSSGNTSPDISSWRATNSYRSYGVIQNTRTLYSYFGKQKWFTDEVSRLYEEHYAYIAGVAADGGLLDSLYDTYGALFKRNFTVWDVKKRWTNYQVTPKGTYEENFAWLKEWCAARHTWLSDYFGLYDHVFVLGDADGNSEVSIFDASMIQRHLATLRTKTIDEYAADVDRDGEISVLDATYVQRFDAGIEVPFQPGVKVTIGLRK